MTFLMVVEGSMDFGFFQRETVSIMDCALGLPEESERIQTE